MFLANRRTAFIEISKALFEFYTVVQPARPSNPVVHASLSSEPIPRLADCIPVDKFDLEPSEFTRRLIEYGDPQAIWTCAVPGSGLNGDAPFGYCKASADLQSVHLYVLPYNYRELSDLLSK